MNAKAERKERSHETILASAARFVRERGIAGAPVAEVMKAAGLTVGGFYAHFQSKEEMIDESLRRMAGEMRERLFAGLDEKPASERAAVVLKRYLSPAHRDEFAQGCPFPAVVGEIATTAPAHRAVLGEQIDAMAAALSLHLPGGRGVSRRQLAIGLVALMYGGLSLARALRGTTLSDDVLKACRAIGATAVSGGGG